MSIPWKKSYDQPRHSIKKWDITMPTNVHIVKAIVLPVVMYRCESWTTEKAEHWRIDTFELWCWRRLLRVPWTARRSNQSINPENSLEGLMLKLQYFGHLLWRAESLEQTLMLGKLDGNKGRGQQKMRWLDSTTDSMDVNWANSGRQWWTEEPYVLKCTGMQRHGHDLEAEQQQ